MTRKKVLITGGCGLIGTILKEALESDYLLTLIDKKQCPSSNVADITDLEMIEPYFKEQDVVIHLAADPSVDARWDSVYHANILGTYNIFEASRRNNVKRIVYASSNHVTGLYEKEDVLISQIVRGEYDEIDSEDVPRVSEKSLPKPDSLYGVSKLFGEGLARYYSSEFGISIICLRIGAVRSQEKPDSRDSRLYSIWLSHRDLAQLVKKAVEAPNRVRFDIFYGVSNNKWRFWDFSHAKEVLGYEPVDDAEKFRSS